MADVDQLVGDVAVDVVHQQLEALPGDGPRSSSSTARSVDVRMRSITSGLACVPPAATSCSVQHAIGLLAREPGRHPPAERLAHEVGAVDAADIEVAEHVVDVARDLVVVVRLVGVAVAEQIDGVAAEPGLDVGDDVARERLEVAARPVEEQHVLALAGHQRPRADAVHVDALDAERDRQVGPDASCGLLGSSMTATAIPVFHSGTGE